MKCPSCGYEHESPTEVMEPILFTKGAKKGQPKPGAFRWVSSRGMGGPPFEAFNVITGVQHGCNYSNFYDEPTPVRTTLDLNFNSFEAFSCPKCGIVFREVSE